jgi:NAD(P)-dependent dehydrogenase (short-subunit alcohol dehydrogenase family)
MSTFAGTKAFADRVTREVTEIDVVCLNAGAISTEFQTGEEGWEKMIEIFLATTLLALLLLPWMKEAGKGNAHLSIVTSMYLLCRSVTHIAQFCCQEDSITGPSRSTLVQLGLRNEI